jgi:hypothetical protein
MSGDWEVAGDDGYDGYDEYGDRCDDESDGGGDDWYNDGHEGGSYSEDSLYGAIIFWIFCITCVAAAIIKPHSSK